MHEIRWEVRNSKSNHIFSTYHNYCFLKLYGDFIIHMEFILGLKICTKPLESGYHR